ncbi:tRNA:m(5)U-54 methyltransferase [Chthonomonas calidirosea]|uniref:Methylenetetrahydrofolate--tRNA-(uracil-5-)-methyltransferase TrmFO n=1 Tax=Chthonomonas calidirosea (strain DSM 23976 / ICMP 18418 / T49) TaxID=1303518 RepID=S0EYU6_CHTCT|nr:methylenetetrahydrofolate--tRNA-(uracil(54)-C(5))-methyltransferase (FADH(2)-oxidizing) TrmFO [Chthonomonas calidirosea]CCW35214.1 tRNA:m(5)U-54 methyltransferase [Chthonomonas calidirosea T49]CEK20768.1 tRNA:m(5)U-54 methyltransferase [Chthonomonas calidirosea]
METITVVGGGFAGVEAAWACAQRGAKVHLYEMRPKRQTPVHRTANLAELVCSNSFKSTLLTNASGVLKEEMRRLGSLILPIAQRHAVPAGEALAVDRERFACDVTAAIESHPNITVIREEVTQLPEARPLILATGPLTSDALAQELKQLTDNTALSFYDAVAPTVLGESLDWSRLFRASRRGRGARQEGVGGEATAECATETAISADYLNCPLTKEEYMAFWEALCHAELAPLHDFEQAEPAQKMVFFEMCVPIEELARRGPRTLLYGPMKPIGLIDPRTGKRPYAVVQLRQENREGTLWGMVGFQTRLKWGEQKRIFRMIPGLENAEFVRYGVMHRNTYVNAPLVLTAHAELRKHPGIFLAGQITGVEGYLESAAIGMIAGINALRWLKGLPPAVPPKITVLGALCHYLVEADPKHFAPMNANWGLVPELQGLTVRDKREKARLKAERALEAISAFAQQIEADWK